MPASRETSRFFATEKTPSETPRRSTRSRTAKCDDVTIPTAKPAAAKAQGGANKAVEREPARSAAKGTEVLGDVEDFGRRASKRQRSARAAVVYESDGESDATLDSSLLSDDVYESEDLPSPVRKPAKRKASAPRKSSSSGKSVSGKSVSGKSVSGKLASGKSTTPPPDWHRLYNHVLHMRRPGGIAGNAAVDTMGCERLADRAASPRDQRFHTLIALMLSSQTKDTVNAVVMKRLQTELPGYAAGAPRGLNLENVLAVEADVLNQMIWAVGFHNNKTKYIKQAAEILRDKWNGDIPDTISGLTSLPGVGPKMAHLCLSHAWQRTEGIGVDVHVHRLTNMWGWNATSSPEETRLALQAWLPRDKWAEINWLLVGFGQTVCPAPASGKNCGACEVGLEGLCRAADRRKVSEGRKWLALAKEEVEEHKDETDGNECKEEDIKRDVKSVNRALKMEDEAADAKAETLVKVKTEQA